MEKILKVRDLSYLTVTIYDGHDYSSSFTKNALDVDFTFDKVSCDYVAHDTDI